MLAAFIKPFWNTGIAKNKDCHQNHRCQGHGKSRCPAECLKKDEKGQSVLLPQELNVRATRPTSFSESVEKVKMSIDGITKIHPYQCDDRGNSTNKSNETEKLITKKNFKVVSDVSGNICKCFCDEIVVPLDEEGSDYVDAQSLTHEVRAVWLTNSIVYFLFGTIFLCLLTFAVVFTSHMNALTDGSLFRDYVKSEIGRREIKSIVDNLNKDRIFQTDFFRRYHHQSTKMPYFSETQRTNERKYAGSPDTDGEQESVRHRQQQIPRRRREREVSSTGFADGEIEFFNPKDRRELERQDAETVKRTGQRGAAPGGDEWIYLTTYCRVPEKVLKGYCKSVQEYCPPNVQGPPGLKGSMGDRGIPGSKGNRGDMGLIGPQGPTGLKGEKGISGSSGLDGRDGVPGEPGLDGIPGRAGSDGTPGLNGVNGSKGEKGAPGLNGNNGLNGEKGARGEKGEKGDEGLPGPRGRGKPGTNGIPGIPGINAWYISKSNLTNLLIPPSISDANSPNVTRPVIVEEGKHLRLVCAAIGRPMPHVEWRRVDGRTIHDGIYEVSSISGHYLNFTNVRRDAAGGYECSASNGIPPNANATFWLEVHFSPMIKISQKYIYVIVGQTARMHCDIEAYPEAIRYWEFEYDQGNDRRTRLIDPGDKYIMETHTNGYKSSMTLTIASIRTEDYGEYHCVVKNELNTTKAIFLVKGYSGNQHTVSFQNNKITIYGPEPPEESNYGEICGRRDCDECPSLPILSEDLRCKDNSALQYEFSNKGGKIEINSTGYVNYPLLRNRTMSCVLYVVGKPVFHKHTNEAFGSWLKDATTKENVEEKIWVTKDAFQDQLFEYENKAKFKNNQQPKTYRIETPFMGNANLVFNGSFYYQEHKQPRVIRYDLTDSRIKRSEDIPYAASNGSNYLYTTNKNYMDFNADENGLWVIYSSPGTNNTFVAKFDENTLRIEYSWNITINHHKFGEMFIICGVLYGVDSVHERNTKIRLALDLYKNVLVEGFESLGFSNPFRNTTTIGYNARNRELYTWDKGNQLTYPVRYHGTDVSGGFYSDENSSSMSGVPLRSGPMIPARRRRRR